MTAALNFQAGVTLGELAIDAQFAIEAGEITAVFGASGAGKSTLLSLVAGALTPARGYVEIAGQRVADAAAGMHLPMERRGIGWVFQDGKLFPHLSVRDNLLFGSRLRAHARGEPLDFDAVVAVLGLAQLLTRHPRDLSGGERQRTAIGRALLSQPRLLLLDEPLASLDAPRRAEILEHLARVRDAFRLPMLYVTHSLGEVLRIADRLLILERGRMLIEGPIGDVVGRVDTPLLALRGDAGALIEAPLLQSASAGGSQLALGDGLVLHLPLSVRPAGAQARVYIMANEVMLAAEQPRAISVRNVLPVRVERVQSSANANLVELRVGQHLLLAALTRDAIEELSIAPGAQCYALIKSVAIDSPAGARLIETS